MSVNKRTIQISGLAVLLMFSIACKNSSRYDAEKSLSEKDSIKTPTTDSLSIKSDSTEKNEADDSSKRFFRTLKNGIRMHVHDYHPENPYPEFGDVLQMSMDYYHKDSLLFTTGEVPGAFKMQMIKPRYPGSIYYGLLQLHEKDSAEFILEAAGFFRYTRELVRLPDFIEKGDSLRFFVKIDKIIPADVYQSEQELKIKDKRKKEQSDIRKYILNHDLEPDLLQGGIYRQIHLQGEGEKITPHSRVSIHYIGLFVDDVPFSDTKKDGRPFTFNMSEEQVIPGLETGLADVREGSKLTLIIPFDQAYGQYKEGPVPPYATLVFNIEVLDVRENKPAEN
ncbi:MAG: FKBP-type peptidyl-prolyl cis-trans isomerase [Bacteroidales bacterium]